MNALNTDADSAASPLASMSSARSVTSTSTGTTQRPYASRIGILPSSLPAYHRDYMAGIANPDAAPAPSEPPAPARTQAEQEETARRLRPHSRTPPRLDESGARPQSLTPVNPPKKAKAVRWQFGIRSRNSPWEALSCIYKALQKLDATWVLDEDSEIEDSVWQLPHIRPRLVTYRPTDINASKRSTSYPGIPGISRPAGRPRVSTIRR